MKTEALLRELEEFQKVLNEHSGLWGKSLDGTLPQYAIQNDTKLKEQSKWLSRKLGAIRPYLDRFEDWVMHVQATGTTWDALDAAVGMASVAQIKGPSMQSVEERLDTIIGRLQVMAKDIEIPENASEPIANDTLGKEAPGERDVLTKLWSRGKMDADIASNLQEAAKSKQPLSLVLIDIDHFKRVNDKHGHQMGDAVLAGVAERLVGATRGKGQVYRYGGEEILIVLPNHDIHEAVAVAERTRKALASEAISGLAVTASFGIGTYPEHGDSSEALVKAADTAMYDAKKLGRNLVRFYGEPPPQAADQPKPASRKLPQPGGLPEDEQKTIRDRHFAGFTVRCPKDGALLNIQELGSLGSSTVDLVIHCKSCGMTDQF
jgi:diguanylate cyclase (GGDEF)-like protein